MTGVYTENIQKIAGRLESAERILFITGAGISAESGLPTYRGIGGLYEEKTTELGLPIEEVLSGEMMARQPETTWRFIGQIEEACRGARFNRAHQVIADIEKRVAGTWVLTQNIDGFHHDAGSSNIIDIHGDIHNLECTNCEFEARVVDYSDINIPPYCEKCNALLRPAVVLFGETLPPGKLSQMSHELEQGFDIIFSIGTTSVFPYIAMPVYNGRLSGAMTVEINPGQSEVSDLVDIRLQQGALQALEDIEQAWQKCLR